MNSLKNRKLLSIIIVNYNSFSLLNKCLLSIEEQSFSFNYEIIIVDNASTEGNVREITENYSNIVLLQNSSNLGFGKANNIGAKHANSEFILLLNNDTEFINNPIDEMVSFMNNSSSRTICAPKLLYSDFSFQASAYKFPTIWRLIASNFFFEKIFTKVSLFNKYYLNIENKKAPIIVDSIIGAFMLMKKSIFEELKGFDENFFFYHEDTDLCYRFTKSGGKIFYFPFLSLIHVGGGSTNKIKWFQLKNKVVARFKFFYKHHSYLYFLLILFIEKLGNFIRVILFFFWGIMTFDRKSFMSSFLYLKTLTLSRKSN